MRILLCISLVQEQCAALYPVPLGLPVAVVVAAGAAATEHGLVGVGALKSLAPEEIIKKEQ